MDGQARVYRTFRPRRWAAAIGLALCAALAVFCALRARTLLHIALDGRAQAPAAPEQTTEFTLRAQMRKEQAASRVSGWLGVTHGEQATLKTARGTLYARLYAPLDGGEGAPWALVLHGGPGTSGAQMLDAACALSLRGYNVLLPDLYAHGQSEGALSSLGVRDAQDVAAWVDWVLARDPDARIALLGQDEGALAILLAAGEGLPDAVAAAALDSVDLDPAGRAEELLARAGVDGPLDRALLRVALRVTAGIAPGSEAALDAAARCTLPLLLISGTLDGETSPVHSERAADAAANARLLLVEGAAHGMARYIDPDGYYGALFSLFDGAVR